MQQKKPSNKSIISTINSMKIGVIGTGGFLAKAIIEQISKEAIALFLFGRTKPDLFTGNQFYQVDLLNDPLPLDKIASCDVIIYAAGLGVQSGDKVNNEDVYAINTFIPIRICESLNLLNYEGLLITFGSYFEIGNTNDLKFFDEEEVIHSAEALPNTYCLSKRLLTQYLHFAKVQFRNYHFILPTIYGKNEHPGRLIPYTIEGFRNKKSLQFTAGTQIRQYLLVEDAVRLILSCIRANILPGIYNFPSADCLNIKDMVKLIGREFDVIVPEESFEKVNRPDSAMQVLQLNADKLSTQIHILPLVTLKEYLTSIKN
jgi:nucleoside-diphosphate-sugar epimerase